MSTGTLLKTAEDLLTMTAADDGRRYELVKGELREMAPTGGTHGKIAFSIASIIAAHIRGKDLGEGFTAEAGFITRRNPDSVRAPDVAFVSKERLPKSGVPEGFVETSPDLAVEVVSPSDTATAIQSKVEEYFAAGTRLVWAVYPDSRSVAVYRSLHDIEVLHEGDELDARPVFEDFGVSVDELFG
jgi:Uma2 family endonuclease